MGGGWLGACGYVVWARCVLVVNSYLRQQQSEREHALSEREIETFTSQALKALSFDSESRDSEESEK